MLLQLLGEKLSCQLKHTDTGGNAKGYCQLLSLKHIFLYSGLFESISEIKTRLKQILGRSSNPHPNSSLTYYVTQGLQSRHDFALIFHFKPVIFLLASGKLHV